MMQSSTAATMPMKRNLRHHLRVPIRVSATIETPTGQQLQTELANLSRTGVMVECNRETLELLHPKAVTAAPGTGAPAVIHFIIPSKIGGKITVDTPCNVVYARRLSRDVFHVGMEFKKLEEHLVPHLEEYIEMHRERQE